MSNYDILTLQSRTQTSYRICDSQPHSKIVFIHELLARVLKAELDFFYWGGAMIISIFKKAIIKNMDKGATEVYFKQNSK
jgi:hypothetical protein